MKAASAQALKVKISRILKSHGCYGKAVGTYPAEKPFQRFDVITRSRLLSIFRIGALPPARHKVAVLFRSYRFAAIALSFVQRVQSLILHNKIIAMEPAQGVVTAGRVQGIPGNKLSRLIFNGQEQFVQCKAPAVRR
jgi:hypothetical protein